MDCRSTALDWFPTGMKAAGAPAEEWGCFSRGEEGLALKHSHPHSIPLEYQDCDFHWGLEYDHRAQRRFSPEQSHED